MNKRREHSIFLLLMLISMTVNTVSINAQSAEMSVINPETSTNNFIFYTSATTVGSRFNATVWVYEVTDLGAYQVYLCVNDTVLNITNAWLPTWDSQWVFNGKTTIKPAPAFYDLDDPDNNYTDCVKIGDTTIGQDSFTGSGILAVIEFEIIRAPTSGSIFSDLNIDNTDTYLLNDALSEIPTEKTSGYYEYSSLPAGTSVISILIDPSSVVFEENVSITGSIVPSKPHVTVSIRYRLNATGEVWQNLTKVQTDSNSQYNHTWETDEAGTFELKALWEGDNATSGAESLAALEVKYASTISINDLPANVTAFSIVTMNGTITPTPLELANVTIEYRLNGTLVWKNLTLTEAVNGIYSYDWTATKTIVEGIPEEENRTIQFRSKWPGDNVTSGSISQIETVVVWKTMHDLTISVSPQEVPTGSNVTITGTIAPAMANLTIRIRRSMDQNETGWLGLIIVGQNNTDINGVYTYIWSISLGDTGEWWLIARFGGNKDFYPTNISMVEAAFINITKSSSNITVAVNPSTINLGSNITINGTLNPPKANERIDIYYRRNGGHWIDFRTITKTNAEGHFNLTWEFWKGGSYDIYAGWDGDKNTTECESSTVTFTVLRNNSSLTIAVDPETIALGGNSTITGTLTPAQALADVTFYYKNATESWVPLATVQTNAEGHFNYTWTPDTAGNFELYVNWTGDDIYAPAESEIVTLKVEEPFTPLTYLPYIAAAIITIIAVAVLAYLLMKRKKKS